MGVCRLGADGRCEGCFRSRAEIGGWMAASRQEKARMWERALREWEARGSLSKDPPPWLEEEIGRARREGPGRG